MELLDQLRELFLGAVPTVILVFLFYFFLRSQFFAPLERVMNEREARTVGARRAAEAAQSAAAEKQRAYEEALKKARAAIYAEQESARRQVLEERAALLRDVRARSNEEIARQKERIATELSAARKEIEREAEALAGEIVHSILEKLPGMTGPSPSGARGAR